MPASDNQKAHDRERILEYTVIPIKERHCQRLAAEADKHARIAIETHDAEHARKALRLRETIDHWQGRIDANRRELEALRSH